MADTNYTALADELLGYGQRGFMAKDSNARVPYGVFYRTASAIKALEQERDALREQATAILRDLNNDAPAHKVYTKVAAMVTGIPVGDTQNV